MRYAQLSTDPLRKIPKRKSYYVYEQWTPSDRLKVSTYSPKFYLFKFKETSLSMCYCYVANLVTKMKNFFLPKTKIDISLYED